MFSAISLQCLLVPILVAVPPSDVGAPADSAVVASAEAPSATAPSVAPAEETPLPGPVEIPIHFPRRLPGERHGAGHGALIGFLVGAGTGASVGLLSGDDGRCSGVCIRFSAQEKVLLLGLPLAVVGAGVGAVIGAIHHAERVHVDVGVLPRRVSANSGKHAGL